MLKYALGSGFVKLLKGYGVYLWALYGRALDPENQIQETSDYHLSFVHFHCWNLWMKSFSRPPFIRLQINSEISDQIWCSWFRKWAYYEIVLSRPPSAGKPFITKSIPGVQLCYGKTYPWVTDMSFNQHGICGCALSAIQGFLCRKSRMGPTSLAANHPPSDFLHLHVFQQQLTGGRGGNLLLRASSSEGSKCPPLAHDRRIHVLLVSWQDSCAVCATVNETLALGVLNKLA